MADETTAVKASLSTAKGKTRGRNPRDIEYQKFDLEKPETLPKSLKEFSEVSGVSKPEDLLAFLIDGFNAYQYSLASDEIGEFVNDAWDKDTAAQFRIVVRNQAKLMGMSIEDVANAMVPAVNKAFEARKAALASGKTETTAA